VLAVIRNKGQSRAIMFISKGASFIAGGFYAPLADDLKKVRKEIAYL
jgi:hypothetical protein